MKASTILIIGGVAVGGYLLLNYKSQSSQPTLLSTLSSLGSGLGNVGKALGSIFGSGSSGGVSTTDPFGGTIFDPSQYGSPSSSGDDSTSSGPVQSPGEIARTNTGYDLNRSAYSHYIPTRNSTSLAQ